MVLSTSGAEFAAFQIDQNGAPPAVEVGSKNLLSWFGLRSTVGKPYSRKPIAFDCGVHSVCGPRGMVPFPSPLS